MQSTFTSSSSDGSGGQGPGLQSLGLQRDVDLTDQCTLKLPSRAAYFSRFQSTQQLADLHRWAERQSLPFFVLGGGSNVLPVPHIEGLVVQSGMTVISVLEQDADSVLVAVDAGVVWHDWVLASLEYGHGLENLALIPGSVGAAPVQNIGAYGVEVAELIEFVDVYQLSTGTQRRMTAAECQFGYRDSVFKQALLGDAVICRVAFRLKKQFQPNIEYAPLKAQFTEKLPTPSALIDAVVSIRQSKLPDPAVIANVGSFFKNPVVDQEVYTVILGRFESVPGYPVDEPGKIKMAAGWLIEKAGWKGRVSGHIGMHDQQALVLVAQPGATLDEVMGVSDQIIADVQAMFGVTLEREPQLFG